MIASMAKVPVLTPPALVVGVVVLEVVGERELVLRRGLPGQAHVVRPQVFRRLARPAEVRREGPVGEVGVVKQVGDPLAAPPAAMGRR